MPISSQPQANPHKNIGTFAGVIGGSVGVLFLLSLGLTGAIYLKRRSARNRTPLPVRDDASLFTEGSCDRPQTGRPTPFIPRYFSDSVHSPAHRRPPIPPPQLRVETRPDPDTCSSIVTDSPVSTHKSGSATHSPIPSISSPHLPPGLPEPSLGCPVQTRQENPSFHPPRTTQETPHDGIPRTPSPDISGYHSMNTPEEPPTMGRQAPPDSRSGVGTEVNHGP